MSTAEEYNGRGNAYYSLQKIDEALSDYNQVDLAPVEWTP